MTQALSEFRQTFATTIGRDTSPVELARHMAVLDALLAWAAARSGRLVPRAAGTKGDAVAFDDVTTKVTCCTLRVNRSAGATLEIYPPTGGALSADDAERVAETLNTYSRGSTLERGDRLRIGFGALKNAAAREAILGLLNELLSRAGRARGPRGAATTAATAATASTQPAG